jgi:hypothetical protein
MAPKQSKGNKRPAPKRENSAAAPPAKKPKLPNEVQALYDVVAAAGLPDDCRDMILAALPSSFMALSSERHPIQHEIVAIVGDVIESTGAQIGNRVDSARQRVSELDLVKEQLQAAIGASELARDDGFRQLDFCKAALASASTSADEAMQNMQAAEEAKKQSDEAATVERADLNILTNAFERQLPQLTGGVEALPSTDEVNAHVQPLLRLLDLDKSLVIALPSACAKKAEERGAFDKMVIDQLMTSLKDKVTELSDKLKVSDEANAALGVAVDAAKQTLASETQRRSLATQEVDAASNEVATREANLATARGSLDAHGPTLADAKSDLAACEAELQNFECYTLECFKRRRDADGGASLDPQPKAAEATETAEVTLAMPTPQCTEPTEGQVAAKTAAEISGLACDVPTCVNVGGA